jgi:hypothetical protein
MHMANEMLVLLLVAPLLSKPCLIVTSASLQRYLQSRNYIGPDGFNEPGDLPFFEKADPSSSRRLHHGISALKDASTGGLEALLSDPKHSL